MPTLACRRTVVQLSKIFNVSTDYLLIDENEVRENNTNSGNENFKTNKKHFKIKCCNISFKAASLWIKEYLYKHPRLILSIISIIFLTAIFVCVFIDYILNDSLTWSLYPVSSCVFVWLTFLPFMLKLKKRKILFSLCIFSMLIIPFLFVMEYASPVDNWVIPLAIPMVIPSLAYLWIAFLLLKSKMNKWYVASILVFLIALLNYFTNYYTSVYLNEIPNEYLLLNMFTLIILAVVIFFIGFALKKKNTSKTHD